MDTSLFLHKKIAGAVLARRKADQRLNDAIANVQARCLHNDIAELPFEYSDYGSSTPPRRMCLRCRLEEEGSIWSGGADSTWSKYDYSTPQLGNSDSRKVVPIDRSVFYKMRDGGEIKVKG